MSDENNNNKINKERKYSNQIWGSFYGGLTRTVLLLCIFVCIAVSHANRATGHTRPDIKIDVEDTNQIIQLHKTIKGKPAKFTTHGIDVSRYQKQISWHKLKRAGVDFAFIKATEGIGLKDSFFDANWQQAKTSGVRRGAYHFFLAEKDPAMQAANFIFNTQLQGGDLPPVLDVEVTRGMPAHVIRKGVKVWLNMVENAYGKKPILYTGYHFYNKYLKGHFNEYPLWIAHYKGDDYVADCKDWTFWQHSDRGKLEGVIGDVDLNVFRGDAAHLDSLCIIDKVKPAPVFVAR